MAEGHEEEREGEGGGVGAAPTNGPDTLEPTGAASASLALMAAGAKPLAELVVSGAKEVIAELRRQAFLYNIFFSGTHGRYQLLGLRISNPHPDAIYIGNFEIVAPAARLRLECVLRSDFPNTDIDPFVQTRRIGAGFAADVEHSIGDDGLTAKAAALDLRGELDRSGIRLRPLDHIDLVLFFESMPPGAARQCQKVELRLAAEGHRAAIGNEAIVALLRNRPA